VSSDAQKVVSISEQGQRASDETVAGMNRIKEQMDAILSSMARLNAQTNEIGNIIHSVDDIAQQSNLLSINAAIEAAKAGDSGRGFAVVAQEVQNLSNESKNATAQVRRILRDVLLASESAITCAKQGTEAVDAGEDLVKQSRSAIQSLSESITQASQVSSQISGTSREQLQGMMQISSAMEQVKESSERNVESVNELRRAVLDLNALGQQLRTLVQAVEA
jgi:methyl-accepting chemotaxis protein